MKTDEIVKKILANYKKDLKIKKIVPHPMPSSKRIIAILYGLREVIFPGYFTDPPLTSERLPHYLSNLIARLIDELTEQIACSFVHECRIDEKVCDLCYARAEKQALKFMDKIPQLRETLMKDLEAAFDGDPAAKSFDEIIYSYPCMMAIATYRLAHELLLQGVPLIPRIMTEYSHHQTGVDIHPGATIGDHFFIDHGTGVVIGETTIIGNRVKMYQGVTLGALSFPIDQHGNLLRNQKRHPTIEDNVTIYAGATILGGDTIIGKGSVIGGNVWLTESVPPGTKVLIESPQLVYKNGKK